MSGLVFRITVRVRVIGLVVAAVYRSLVLRVSLISYVMNADSGRCADALISYTET